MISKVGGKYRKNHCYFTDWLRSVACVLVLSVHGMVAVQRIMRLDKNNKELSDNYIMALLHHGMPVFFYASGRAAFFSTRNSDKGGFLNFVYKKAMRLLVPSAVGYFTVVAAAAFLGSEWRPCAPARPYHSLVDFYTRFIAEFNCSGLEWLWTLPMIFIIAVVNRPFTLLLKNIKDHKILRLAEDKRGKREKTIVAYPNHLKEVIMMVISILSLVLSLHLVLSLPFEITIPIVLSYLAIPLIAWVSIKSVLKERNSLLITSLLAYLPLYIASLYIGLKLDDSIKAVVSANPNPGRNVLVSGFRLVDEEQPLRLLISLVFYNFYYLAGFLDLILEVDFETERNSYLRNFATCKVVLLISANALSFPGNKSLVTYIWAYPYYSGGITTAIFVAGTWVWLEFFRMVGTRLFNEVEISDFLQTHFSHSGMVIYITHPVWLELITRYFLLHFITPESPFSLYDASLHMSSLSISGFRVCFSDSRPIKSTVAAPRV
ncbi:Acyltransferase 3 [Cryptosporidium felis]|nr:Acyltransferase 3 [Cryptosporidium felis]